MPKVFISYRREDSAAAAGRICDKLGNKLGEQAVFFDINTIPFGTNFRLYIEEVLMQCDVLLAVIGDNWLRATYDDNARKGQRRLDDPDDFVRTEIELALKNGITVIPVLVAQAKIPAAHELPASLADLAFLNAAEARSSRDFHSQMDRLIQQIDQSSSERKKPNSDSKSLVFQKIWYRQKIGNMFGFGSMLTKLQFKDDRFDDKGLLMIRAEGIEFIGKKFQILIKNIQNLSRGRHGADPRFEWVKIEYEENNEQRIAFFANGQLSALATIFYQNDKLFEAIRETYGLKDA